MSVRKELMTERQRYFGEKLGQGERGSTLVLVTLFIIVLFGFAALSLDVANAFRQKQKVHAATDAAALAGVDQVGDPTVPPGTQSSDAITEADVIANTNGVTDAEIASGAVSNAGTIEVGFWDGSTFTANVTPYNAVSVPAQRTVPLTFGKAVGLFSQMTPTVDSIAAIGAHPIPYGVPSNAVGAVGSTLTLQNWSPGNWGPIDLCGAANGKNQRINVTTNGCYSNYGQVTTASTGFEGVSDAFQDLCGQTVVLPVTSGSPNGQGEVTIINFIVVELNDPNCGTGSGSNWKFTATILGVGFSGLREQGMGPIRSLVE
jgi:hypothetical protein